MALGRSTRRFRKLMERTKQMSPPLPVDNFTHIGEDFYVVRTQAGFKQAIKHWNSDLFEEQCRVINWPVQYPLVVTFSVGYSGTLFIRTHGIHLNTIKEALRQQL